MLTHKTFFIYRRIVRLMIYAFVYGMKIFSQLRIIFQITDDFNISKIMCAVHDNAANMGVAMRRLDENDVIKNDIGCFAHTLQLAIKSSIEKNTSVEHMLAVVRSNSRFFRKSSVGWGILKEKQNEAEKTPLRPIMDVAVRWNSAFLMVQR